MTLIKSISGIRGTLGGKPGETLSPVDIVRFTSAYAMELPAKVEGIRTVVIGRDARTSGPLVANLVSSTLTACGIDVLDLGLSTTPTVEMAVTHYNADGGIILTASHNPGEWNALKLLNAKGEFISASEGQAILDRAAAEDFEYVIPDLLGTIRQTGNYIEEHIQKILELPYVDMEAIRRAKFRIAIDAVNSTGGIAIPPLLKALGVNEVIELYTEPNGLFPHNPEPLPQHLTELSDMVRSENCDLGFTVDPDVDRLAIVCEDGSMFGEEYTLVAVADYILGLDPGPTVSNLSSSRALRDVTEAHQQSYAASAVGEVNVVASMKETGAVIGGEGNGGIIYPALHYGRDALVGIALFLSHLAKKNIKVSELRRSYPEYTIVKQKVQLEPATDVDALLGKIAVRYKDLHPNTSDGVKIDDAEYWIHLRKSNTEPIIRLYCEARDKETANKVAAQWMNEIATYL